MIRTDEKEWYQQFWPWFLMTLPASVIVACLYTIYLINHNPMSMVKKDYYNEGLTINKNISLLKHSAELGLQAELLFTGQHKIDVHMLVKNDFPDDKILTLQFDHPVDDTKDMTLTLERVSKNNFSTAVIDDSHWQQLHGEKRWYIYLYAGEDSDHALWMLQGETSAAIMQSLALDSRGH